MLDANARHLRKGVKFFVSCHIIDDCLLAKLGAKTGQYYLCKMLDSTKRHPRFSMKIDGVVHEVKHVVYGSFLVYEGTPSGTGFISKCAKKVCEKVIGDFNSTYRKRCTKLLK